MPEASQRPRNVTMITFRREKFTWSGETGAIINQPSKASRTKKHEIIPHRLAPSVLNVACNVLNGNNNKKRL